MEVFSTFWNATKGYFNWFIDQVFLSSASLYGNYFWLLTIISLFFFGLEIFKPWREKQPLFRKDFWLDLFYMYFNVFLFDLLIRVGLAEVVEQQLRNIYSFIGIKNTVAIEVQSWPIWAKFLLMFLLQDFTHWNVHRLLHKVPFLWQFHKLHHSVKEMGFAAHLRFHWMESIIYKSITYIPLLFIGFGVTDFFYLHIFTLAWGHFNHANFVIPLGPLKYLFNNPQMHIWHHAKELPKEHPSGVNFGITLSIWDYIFKTNYIPKNGRDIELGFDGDKSYPKKLWKQLIYGFDSEKS